MDNVVKILVVDDDPNTLELCTASLEASGAYRVLTATNAPDGMRIAEEHRPLLIISDYYMPVEDGFQFCRKIKSHPVLRDTMFMVLTGATETEHKVRGLDIGADDYVTKPFKPVELASRARALLRIAHLQTQLKEENAELEALHEILHQSFTGVINLLTHIIGLRVPNATARAQRASQAGQWLGRRLGMDGEALKNLDIAVLVHEVGKISLRDDLLRKRPDELTPMERETISQFPLFGQLLVGCVPQLEVVGTYLRHQLENYDGTGFPDRLRREQIPLASRILRAVNLIEDAGTVPNRTTEEFVGLVCDAQGTILDPHVVQLIVEYMQINDNPSWLEGKYQVPVDQLKEGMVLAMDLCTGSGMKLLPKNSTLSQSNVRRILALHKFDPIINEIYVYENTPAPS